jgi:diphthine-ammonia ligase
MMRLAGLFSGGKDSVYSTHLVEEEGYIIPILACMYPSRLDSWMFHSINLWIAPLLAETLGKSLVSASTNGEKEKELEDLKRLISRLDVDGIVTGAIASTYQHDRINKICQELGLVSVSPLWNMNPREVLEAEIDSGMEIIMTAVAAKGLDQTWLGRRIDKKSSTELIRLSEYHGFNVCGEGGEYETTVIDAPWFKKRIEVLETETTWDGTSGIYLIKKAHLVEKT